MNKIAPRRRRGPASAVTRLLPESCMAHAKRFAYHLSASGKTFLLTDRALEAPENIGREGGSRIAPVARRILNLEGTTCRRVGEKIRGTEGYRFVRLPFRSARPPWAWPVDPDSTGRTVGGGI